jgi:hypothetical protein
MPRCRRPLILAWVVVVAPFSLLAAACGGGGSPGVARIASSTTAVTPPQNGLVAFPRCMRSNGVPRFPDPSPSRTSKPSLQQLGVSGPQYRAALSACAHLLPNGGQSQRPTITPADRADYLRGAECMRSHGLPAFPDPTFQSNNVTFNIPSGIDTNSPQFRSAATTCDKLIPPGLPYSSPPTVTSPSPA